MFFTNVECTLAQKDITKAAEMVKLDIFRCPLNTYILIQSLITNNIIYLNYSGNVLYTGRNLALEICD